MKPKILFIVMLAILVLSSPAIAKDDFDKLDYRVEVLEQQVAALIELTTNQQAEIDALETNLALANSAITDLQTLASANQSVILDLGARIETNESAIIALQTHADANELDIIALQSSVSTVQADIADIHSSPISELNSFVSVEYDEIEGVYGPHVIFEGANVHIRSGYGQTNDNSTGLGNLIVGYNELLGITWSRDGAHNLVLGIRNGFTSYGGIVAGNLNRVSAPYATITGGAWNEATGLGASVSGGEDNVASASSSSICGGHANTASGFAATVSGGAGNQAIGGTSSVSGGLWNWATGARSSVSGGQSRVADNEADWAAGSLWEDN
jgi:hypothetical protein